MNVLGLKWGDVDLRFQEVEDSGKMERMMITRRGSDISQGRGGTKNQRAAVLWEDGKSQE